MNETTEPDLALSMRLLKGAISFLDRCRSDKTTDEEDWTDARYMLESTARQVITAWNNRASDESREKPVGIPVAKLRDLIARWEAEISFPPKYPGPVSEKWREALGTAACDLGCLLDKETEGSDEKPAPISRLLLSEERRKGIDRAIEITGCENLCKYGIPRDCLSAVELLTDLARELLKAEFEKPEPVAWMYQYSDYHGQHKTLLLRHTDKDVIAAFGATETPLYTAPPVSTEDESLEKQYRPINKKFIIKCRAARHGDIEGCEWPLCGCDEKATIAVDSLKESGHFIDIKEREELERDAKRYQWIRRFSGKQLWNDKIRYSFDIMGDEKCSLDELIDAFINKEKDING